MNITMKRKRKKTTPYIEDKEVNYGQLVKSIYSEYFKVYLSDIEIENKYDGSLNEGMYLTMDGEETSIRWIPSLDIIKNKETLQRILDDIISDCKRFEKYLNSELVETIELTF